MINYKQTARFVGIIFLAGMLAGIPGNIMVQSLTAGPDYLQALSAQHMTLAIGALLMLSTAIGDATHGILMYPILKKHHGQLAAGYFGFRIINATFLALQVLFIVLQVPIAEAYSGSALPDPPIWQALSHLCIKANLLSYQLAMIFLGIAGVVLCYSFYKTKYFPVVWPFGDCLAMQRCLAVLLLRQWELICNLCIPFPVDYGKYLSAFG